MSRIIVQAARNFMSLITISPPVGRCPVGETRTLIFPGRKDRQREELGVRELPNLREVSRMRQH